MQQSLLEKPNGSPERDNWTVYNRREFNERSGRALLDEFLWNGRTNH
jgi:hypothetical protein